MGRTADPTNKIRMGRTADPTNKLFLMSALPSPTKPFEAREPLTAPAASARARPVGVKRGWRRSVVLLCGIITAFLAAAFCWLEYDPPALAQAEAAYRRNELDTAL